MLTDLLFGSYRKKVLSEMLLHPDADYHVRELARVTGTAAGTLHKELARLAESGLLLRKAQGNQVRYQANRQCPVFEELAGLMRKTAGAAEVLLEAVAPLRPDVALIFGSIARGTETAGSDADLLLIGDIGFAEAVRATYPAQAKLGREINPIVHSAAEFKRRAQAGDPFIHDVMGNKKIFLIGTEHDLGELAGHPAPASV
jgi:predicted nucleotidyltransferase/DNA-binding HxlR family transcriptional regulator